MHATFSFEMSALTSLRQWCQDLEVEPLLILFAGLHLDGTIISENDLNFYIQDALNEIEFVTGDASTEYGAKRAALGYEEPFPLNFVGVSQTPGILTYYVEHTLTNWI